jgi:hypothetical protein
VYPELNSTDDLTFLAADNNRRLTKEMAFNHIIGKHIAADLAHIILTQSRNRKNIAFDATAELHEATVNDIINVDYEPLAIDSNFRIKTVKINADYTISITAQEHIPADYVFTDTSTVYGSSNQLKYVDNIATTKYYAPNPDGTWDGIIAPPANANEPSLPVNSPSASTADFNINSIATRVVLDNPKNPRMIINVKIVIADILADQIYEVTVENFSNKDNQFLPAGSFQPGQKTKVGGFYEQFVGIDLDGSDHLIRVNARLDNGDRLPTATTTFTAPASKYSAVQNTTF